MRDAPRQRRLSARRPFSSESFASPPISPKRWTAASSSWRRCRRTARATCCGARRRTSVAARRRQRDQRTRAGHAVPRVGDRRAGAGGAGDAVAVLSGPSFAVELARELPDGRLDRVARCRRRRAGAGGIPSAVLPAVRHRRCRRRRDRRRAEERHRDRGRRGRRAGPRAQRAGRSDHARSGRDLAAGLCGRREARNARRPDRTRRSGADVHRALSRNRHVGVELASGRALQDVLAA